MLPEIPVEKIKNPVTDLASTILLIFFYKILPIVFSMGKKEELNKFFKEKGNVQADLDTPEFTERGNYVSPTPSNSINFTNMLFNKIFKKFYPYYARF